MQIPSQFAAVFSSRSVVGISFFIWNDLFDLVSSVMSHPYDEWIMLRESNKRRVSRHLYSYFMCFELCMAAKDIRAMRISDFAWSKGKKLELILREQGYYFLKSAVTFQTVFSRLSRDRHFPTWQMDWEKFSCAQRRINRERYRVHVPDCKQGKILHEQPRTGREQ